MKRTDGMELEQVYAVPRTVDDEGREWYTCLSDMSFASRKIGWAVGSTQILHTQDAGKTWVNQFSENRGCFFLNPHRVFAVSGNVCWIVAISSSTEIRCCYTNDGGETWKGKEFKPKIYPNDIFFIDSKRGWLVSDDGSLPAEKGFVYLTEDGGENWKALETRIDGKPYKIRFSDAQKGWLIEHYVNHDQTRTYSRLLTSEDGGYGWRKVSRFDRRIFDFQALDENHIFAVGEAGYIAESIDGGQSWKRIESKSRANLNAVRFFQNRMGIALGDFNTLLLSTDSRKHWDKITISNGSGFLNAHFETNRSGVVASSNAIYSFKLDR